jgi:hypothetical protein
MTPVITHLQANVFELPAPALQESLTWTFDASIKRLGTDFYRKIIPLNPVLNIEYSVLCHQIRHHLSFPLQMNQEQLIEQLIAALMLAELLEHVHLYYLIVPREVVRLRRQQGVYRALLVELAGYSFSSKHVEKDALSIGLSLSQQVREYTVFINWFRLLLTRSKRVLNFLDLVGTGSEAYRNFVSLMDKYTNPFFSYLAWCFFIPRLFTNLFLLFKHTIPWPWMGKEEQSLGWFIRLEAHLKRRWFELANDIVWVTVGLLNCFLFTGVLAPVAVYLTLAAFAFDMANSSFRAYIELNRLYELQKEYTVLLKKEENQENKIAIKDYQNFIKHRIDFEHLRLSLSLISTGSVFIAMCLAIPGLVLSPVVPFIGALLLIAIWVANFTLTRALEHYRPKDNVEMPSGLVKIGFFAQKNDKINQPSASPSNDVELSDWEQLKV